MVFLATLCLSAAPVQADIVRHIQGAVLTNSPDYDWWYGCSPTSAGMMMGYYDRNGYNGLLYDNLVPGGVAELSNYGNPSAIANSAIASAGHIADFYVDGYGKSGDDVDPPHHSFNSLADFMGTSQDSVGNSNGSTTFWNYSGGSRLYAIDIYDAGASYWQSSGMYGLWEYEQYAGYGSGGLAAQNIFNQYILGHNGNEQGFTWENYVDEIDAGRPVMIHVEGHSMFGYGYDDDTDEIILHDTWTEGEHRMAWSGAYSGLDHYGVTVFEPTGGVVPVPAAVLLGMLGFGAAGLKLRKYV